ncbi:MAG: CinA family protein [Lachnospiraceae bacterium]|nr:CinA family protein [Lachnospiraceae bacterium]
MVEISEKLVQSLAEMGLTISTAESCTGGMLASAIIDVAGASEVFSEGFITYSNEAKIKYLDVKAETLEEFGAVSQQTVLQMAAGCAKQAESDVAVVTSGVAGPGGGTQETPVGFVYIACAYKDVVTAKSFKFDGDRFEIRRQATAEALKMTLELLENQ